jgi:hypothetical protein
MALGLSVVSSTKRVRCAVFAFLCGTWMCSVSIVCVIRVNVKIVNSKAFCFVRRPADDEKLDSLLLCSSKHD